MVAHRFCITLASVALAASAGLPAFAQDAPIYSPGDIFVFDNKRVERFLGETTDGLRWASRSGREYVRPVSFFAPTTLWESRSVRGERVIRGDISLWPAKRGKASRFTAVTTITEKKTDKSRRSAQNWWCRIGRSETVSTPAGEFSAMPIQCDSYSTTTFRILRERVWHFAPSVGHYVKRRDVNYLTGESSEFALVAKLSGRMANERRVEAILDEMD